jgi:hypothetical protein
VISRSRAQAKGDETAHVGDVQQAAIRGTAFALSVSMNDKRHGAPDRRASRRGGRRTTDTMRSDVDAIRLQWELDLAPGSSLLDDTEPPDDDSLAGRPHGHNRRSLPPPRK